MNSGTLIELKAVSINYRIGLNVDDSASPVTFEIPEINPISIQAPKITVSGVLKRTVTADMDLMVNLRNFAKSKGVKLVYYNDTTDGYREITDSLGEEFKDDIHKSINFSNVSTPHIHCVIVGFTINQVGNSEILTYTLTMEETV